MEFKSEQQRYEAGELSPEEIKQLSYHGIIDVSKITPEQVAKNQSLYLDNKTKELEVEKQRIEMMKKQGLNPDGSPIRKDFQGISNADGTLQDTYKLKDWQDVTANTDALNKFKETALRDAGVLSPWAKLELQKQELEQSGRMDSAARSGANNMVSALSNLAQTGGYTGAQRERMARTNMRDELMNRQNVLRQGQLDKLNISSQDEQSRMTGLGQLQNMENGQADIRFKNQEAGQRVNSFNIQNMLKEVEAKRGWDTDTYKESMSKWAANKQAEAQAKAAGGGGKK